MNGGKKEQTNGEQEGGNEVRVRNDSANFV